MPAPISLLGIPLDLGASVRGASLGPAAFRIADLAGHLNALGHEVQDLGDVAPETPRDSARGRFGNHDDVLAGWMRAIRRRATDAFAHDRTPIFLGGDHSLSMGTVTAAAAQARASNRDFALLWIDAHADYNTPSTSPSGNMHGMSVAFLTGDEELNGFSDETGAWLKPSQVHLVGLRSIDREERQALADDGLTCVDMRMIDEFGISALMRDLLGQFDPVRTHLHVSFDLDVVDPTLVPGVGTPVQGGLTYREAHLIMEMLHESGLVRSLDVVELNPFLDDRGSSARLAVDLIGSLFGRTVLARPNTRRDSAE